MLNKNNEGKCGSGDAIVDYIYEEMSSEQKIVFEDHLLSCTACTDEFAAVADSRYSVYEWQKLEFEPMETPRFVIPYAEVKSSWFNAFKSIFSTGPRLAGAGAFALLVAAIGFGSLLMTTDEVDVVSAPEIKATEPSPETRSMPSTEVIPQPETAPEFVAVKESAPKAARKSGNSSKQITVRSQKVDRQVQAKAPRLNDFEELSDDSLRLSDLVADVDTKD
jgi:hypothetical protein